MTCEARIIEFAGGDEVVQPFLLRSGDIILDLTDCEVTAEIRWANAAQITLADGDGLDFVNRAPVAAAPPAVQIQHGNITLTEAQTLQIPLGLVAYLRFIVVRLGITTSTRPARLKRTV